MNTQTHTETSNSHSNSWSRAAVFADYGIDLRQFGIDLRKDLPERVKAYPVVLKNGCLQILKYLGRKATLYLWRTPQGEYWVTIKYIKSGKRLRVPLEAVAQPAFRSLHETFTASAEHGFLRLRRDEEEAEKCRNADRAAVEFAGLSEPEVTPEKVKETEAAEVAEKAESAA
jgi:hypothetical protein